MSEQCLALCGSEGVTGTVLVACSAALEDNQWLLDVSDRDRFILGLVGHVDSGRAFRADTDRFARHPRFVGIRSSACSVAELRHLVRHCRPAGLSAQGPCPAAGRRIVCRSRRARWGGRGGARGSGLLLIPVVL